MPWNTVFKDLKPLKGHKMKNVLRLACLAVLALTVVGCGMKPQVPERTIVAAYVDLEKAYENGTLLAQSIINQLPDSTRSDAAKEYESILASIDKYKDALKPKWMIVAFGGTLKDLSRAPSENLAIAIRIDTDEKTADDVLRQWVTEKVGREVEPDTRKEGVIYEVYSFYAGRIEDDLLILANSKDAFMDMFNLYTGKDEPSKDFGDLARISGHTVARISTAPVHRLLSRFELTEEIEKAGVASDDEDLADMILNLGTITLDILADGNDLGLSLRIVCGSSNDAKLFEHVFQTISFMSRAGFDLSAYLAQNPDRLPPEFRRYRNAISQTGPLFNAAAHAFDAARDGRVAEITFATSMDMIAKAIAKAITPEKPVETSSAVSDTPKEEP